MKKLFCELAGTAQVEIPNRIRLSTSSKNRARWDNACVDIPIQLALPDDQVDVGVNSIPVDDLGAMYEKGVFADPDRQQFPSVKFKTIGPREGYVTISRMGMFVFGHGPAEMIKHHLAYSRRSGSVSDEKIETAVAQIEALVKASISERDFHDFFLGVILKGLFESLNFDDYHLSIGLNVWKESTKWFLGSEHPGYPYCY